MKYRTVGSVRQSGFSLIEVLIAMVLGLVVILGVINVFVSSNHSTKFNDGLREMQENGRHAVFVMQVAIRQAGFTTDRSVILLPIKLANSSSNKISIRSQSERDCTGGNTDAVDGVAINEYYLDEDTNQVLCQGNVGTEPMALIDGVEALRFMYGLDEDEDKIIERYVSFSEVTDSSTIAAVKVALLITTEGPIKDTLKSKSNTVLDINIASSDRLGRQVYSTSILIRNRSSSL